MNYTFNEDFDISIEDRILKLNNISKEKLDVSNFNVEYNFDVINNFKDCLLANKDKRFLIVGDYDCDGICATTIIKKLFDYLNIQNNYYIPSRIKDGYGINNKIVDNAYNNSFDCIICLDNGIVAKEQLSYAKKLGLIVYIIDHHEYEEVPDCYAYLHPNLFPDDYQNMCAGGLCCLLANSFVNDDVYTLLGGLATIADMVDIFGYNRYLVSKIKELIKKNVSRPINYLLGDKELNYKNIQFSIVPKINAVSRLDEYMNVNYVVKYLLSSEKECLAYYDKIEIINEQRKLLSKQMVQKAKSIVDNSRNIIVVKSDEFKEGLCGIVANKLMDEYQKPAIVLSKVDGILKGSGRSIAGSNLYEYLKGASSLFDTFGGHELAIGLGIKEENFDAFIDYIDNHDFSYDETYKDVIVLDSNEIDFSLLETIENLKPFGTSFVEPLYALKNPSYQRKYIVANKYPKFEINDILSAISFNQDFKNKEFEYMIGRIESDTYSYGKISFLIEDLV